MKDSHERGDPSAPPDRVTNPDAALAYGGVFLLLAGMGWLWLTAEAGRGDAAAMTGMIALIALAFAAAREAARRHALVVPTVVVAGVGVYGVVRYDTLMAHTPALAPLGYSNAAGTLFMLAAAAALLLQSRTRSPSGRFVALAVGFAFALMPWGNETRAAAILVCLIPLALLARGARGVRVVVVVSGAAVLLTFLLTVALAASYQPGRRDGWVAAVLDATVSERRLMLWQDALVLLRDNLLTGVGPERFPELSPTAVDHPDTMWPHSEALHFAAEAGLPGLAFALGLIGWGFLRLWRGGADTGAAVAAAALGAAGVHSNIDYVLHYPAVVVVAAALVGAGSRARGGRHPSRRPVGAGRRAGSGLDAVQVLNQQVGATP